MKETSLYELHNALPVRLPISDYELGQDRLSIKLKDCLTDYKQEVAQHLSSSMHDFFSDKAN